VIRITAFFISLLCIAGTCYPSFDKTKISGIIADAGTHAALASAAIIVQEYTIIEDRMFQDSVFSDSVGKFLMTLSDSNHFTPSIAVEKNGYKTRSVKLPLLNSETVVLDTIFLTPYTLHDSVTYSISGAVTDTGNAAVRGATVTVSMLRDKAAFYSVNTTTSQWGGYFNVTTKQPFLHTPVTVRLKAEKTGFLSTETSQTLASSAQNFSFAIVLNKSPSSVISASHTVMQTVTASPRSYTVDGRNCGVHGKASTARALVRVLPDRRGRIVVQTEK
jgi:hypothetical protein